ncbi:MAG: hypothetical protein A2X86_01030 [Bdellovibrionales bacterium GWA2_49_15]|nr:MAG: hypothetical protein A2X86_01030 [Bdellovibrionales bacterium GWA2_49_15]
MFKFLWPVIFGLTMGFSFPAHRGATREGLVGFSGPVMTEIEEANLSVDKGLLENTRAAHFDSDTFAGGSAFIKANFNQALEHLGDCDVANARKSFGMALHTLQDFYAHSNWVENHLGNLNADMDLMNLQEITRVQSGVSIPAKCCRDMALPQCSNFGLTTGYWKRDNLDNRHCSHASLNKDYPTHRYHVQAREAATQATRKLLRQFLSQIVAQNGERRGTYLAEYFSGTQTNQDPRFCSREIQVACKQNPVNLIPSKVQIILEQIINKLLEREVPEDHYEQ